jgi:S-adenosyl-L-methionine hydrolase (adenosine-forming)
MGIIALITDYGESDWFAGEMKAAILNRAPGAVIVDVTHQIPPCDIRCAAFSLMCSYRTFPSGTVFCIVVDPGVGTNRAALAAECKGDPPGRGDSASRPYYFVGPDNGVLSWALKKEPKSAIRIIERPELLPAKISATFHGRDIFGPIAAHLSAGTAFETIGPVAETFVQLPWPSLIHEKNSVRGSIIHIDRFGNAVTTIDAEALASLPRPAENLHLVKYGNKLPIRTYFQEVPSGQGLGYIGSAGYLEIAINNANAATVFGLHIGDKVEVS